jgi:hypothetical protein
MNVNAPEGSERLLRKAGKNQGIVHATASLLALYL